MFIPIECGYCGSDQIQECIPERRNQRAYRYCRECHCLFIFHPLAGWLRETRTPQWVCEAIKEIRS